jgi:hypothetical protein
MGRGCEGEACLIKNDVSGDHDTIGGKVKAAVPFAVWGIADEDTPGGMERKLMWGCRGQVGVAGTPKKLEMLIGRWCAIEGGVRTRGSDGFHQKMVQQVCGSVETLYLILWWHGSLKQQSANNVVGGAQHTLGFTVLRRGVWARHPEVHAMSKEKLPQGGVVELTPIVTLDALNHAAELSANKRKELGDSQKGVRLQAQTKSPRVV